MSRACCSVSGSTRFSVLTVAACPPGPPGLAMRSVSNLHACAGITSARPEPASAAGSSASLLDTRSERARACACARKSLESPLAHTCASLGPAHRFRAHAFAVVRVSTQEPSTARVCPPRHNCDSPRRSMWLGHRPRHTGVPEPVVVSVVRHMRVHDCCRTFNEHVEERGSYVKLKVLVVALVPCSGTSDSRWHGGLACPADMHMAAAHGRVRPAPARCMATATTAAAHGRVRPTPALHVSNTKTASTVGTPCFPLDYSLCWNTYFFRQHRTHIGCNIAGHADRDAGPATARIRTRLNGHDGPLGV